MAATVRIVPQKDWEVLRKYIGDTEGCVLIPQNVLDGLSDEQKSTLEEISDTTVDYDFGGEADLWVDIVRDQNACFLSDLFEEDMDNGMGGI